MSKKRLDVASVLVALLLSGVSISGIALEEPLEPSSLVQNQDIGKQRWNLQNADIRAVIQTVSELTGKNFVVDPRVQGRVTLVSAKPMTNDEMYHAFLSMLQVLNYAAITSGDIVKIVPSMDAKGYGGTLALGKDGGHGDEIVVRIVPVNNVSAMQMVSILRPLMLDWGNVSAYQPSNSLVLAGGADNIRQLETIIHHLDQNDGSSAEVVTLKYADAVKLASVIQALQNANNVQGKVTNVAVVSDAGTNTLLVSGNEANRRKILALIRELDVPNAAGGNNTAVVRLNYLTAKVMAPMLTKLAHGYIAQARKAAASGGNNFGVTAEGGDGQVSIQPVTDANAVVMSGPHQIVQSLKNVIAELDTRPQEVLVQAIIVKIDESMMSQFGVQWGMGDPRTTATSDGSKLLNKALESGVGYIHSGSFGAIIQALTTNGNNDILATPSILVLNNQKATISDGKNIGMYNRQYSAGAQNNGDSTVPFNTFDRKDVTLSLNVTPQIAPDNTVRLVIKQKDDSLAQDAQNKDPNNPTINTSKINTTVLVNSGDILVLGGLISNNDTEQDQKIPVLGDIPLLGKLFHSKTRTAEKKNLMVFIRPVIINSKEEAEAESLKKYDYIRYQQLRKNSGMPLSGGEGAYPLLPAQSKEKPVNLPPPFE